MSFGPVNGEGGERRLNVFFTRARIRTEVFTSFDPGDIDVSRTAGEGTRILKRFQEFAKNGRADESSPTGLDADNSFEEDVADIIRSYGFLADPQVGSAGFRIDIGVRHPDKPGTYLLAVECDGATYHSALWARSDPGKTFRRPRHGLTSADETQLQSFRRHVEHLGTCRSFSCFFTQIHLSDLLSARGYHQARAAE